jgi:hypothetical protein
MEISAKIISLKIGIKQNLRSFKPLRVPDNPHPYRPQLRTVFSKVKLLMHLRLVMLS